MWTRDVEPPRPGQPVRTTTRATLVLAANANPWTFEGTNTWVLAEPGDPTCGVVDPGPDDETHFERVIDAAQGRTVGAIWLTHCHHDHAGGAARLAAMTGAPIRAASARIDSRPLGDGDHLTVGRLRATVVATPGHTADSVSFLVPADGALLTGDTVLGRGTPMVQPGGLGDMLATLRRLSALCDSPGTLVLPGHGPTLADPKPEIERRIAARLRRIDQVAQALDAGASGYGEIVDLLYDHLDPMLRQAAEMSVAATVDHLRYGQPGGSCRLVGR